MKSNPEKWQLGQFEHELGCELDSWMEMQWERTNSELSPTSHPVNCQLSIFSQTCVLQRSDLQGRGLVILEVFLWVWRQENTNAMIHLEWKSTPRLKTKGTDGYQCGRRSSMISRQYNDLVFGTNKCCMKFSLKFSNFRHADNSRWKKQNPSPAWSTIGCWQQWRAAVTASEAAWLEYWIQWELYVHLGRVCCLQVPQLKV